MTGMEHNPQRFTQTVKIASSVPDPIPGPFLGTKSVNLYRWALLTCPFPAEETHSEAEEVKALRVCMSWVAGVPSLWEAFNARPGH